MNHTKISVSKQTIEKLRREIDRGLHKAPKGPAEGLP